MADEFRPQVCGFALASDQVPAGSTATMWFEFANLGGHTAAEHTVFVHVRPASAGGADVPPATGGDFVPFLPTYAWPRGAVVAEDGRQVAIPADFPPGRYDLFVGLYDPDSGQRVALANDDIATDDLRYLMGTFDALPADATPQGQPLERRWVDTSAMPTVWAALESGPQPPTLALEDGDRRVVLSAELPRVLRYELGEGPALDPGRRDWPVRARFCREGDATYHWARIEPGDVRVRHQGRRATYAIRVWDGEALAGAFDVTFALDDERLTVAVGNVVEEPGYLLMDVTLPPLLGVGEPGGGIVIPNQGGRLLDLSRSATGQATIRMDWFVGDLCGLAIQGGALAAIRTRDWDNELRVWTAGAEGSRAAQFEPRFALRARAAGPAAKIRLAETPSFEIGLLRDHDGDGQTTWVDGAKWLRRDLDGVPSPIYRDCLVYKIFCDSPGSTDYTTYDDALEVIRTAHRLAPWQKQVVYLVGWQYEGHDTGYPATDVLNARLGTIDDLRRITAEAAELNAIVSYHDNFDDAYPASPEWDEATIAHNDVGELQAGGVWAGGQSYILAFAKYARAHGLERVRQTLARLPVRESYHIDVLSAVPLRRDFNPEAPESTRDSIEGKIAIVREFNRRGVDVTSEGFTAPFVGVIGHAWHFWHRPDTIIPGERAIPFLAFIYHGGPTCWGNGAQSDRYPQDSALHGAGFSTDWMKHADPHDMARSIYLVNVPWAALRERKMQDFHRDGTIATLTYGDDTFVRVNEETGQWTVVVDGEILVEDDLVVVRRDGLVAVFSPAARHVTVALPAGLRGHELEATNALTGEPAAIAGEPGGAQISLDLPASEPILVRPRTH